MTSAMTISAYAQGPWATGKGKAYFKLSEWWISSDEHFTDIGEIDPNTTLGLYNTSIYAEYGLTDRLSVVANLPVFSRATINNVVSATTGEIVTPGDAINSIGDVDLSLSYMLTPLGSPLALSASVTAGIPLGEEAGGIANNLQTGDGEFNTILRIDAGGAFKLGNANAFAKAFTAYNLRSEGFSDEARFGIEAGVGFGEKPLWIVGRFNFLGSLENSDPQVGTTSASLFSNDIRYTLIGVEVSKYITKRFGISAGIADYISGEIILSEPSYQVGVFLDLKN